jgi:hypothetical protein
MEQRREGIRTFFDLYSTHFGILTFVLEFDLVLTKRLYSCPVSCSSDGFFINELEL